MAQLKGDAGSSAPLAPDRKTGVWGQTDDGYGVAGTANQGNGLQAGSISGFGAVGTSDENYGVFGISKKTHGVYGRTDQTNGDAGVAAGVVGESNQPGSYGVVGNGYQGVLGNGNLNGVVGKGSNIGAAGISADQYGTGVAGFSEGENGVGIYAEASGDNGTGISINSRKGLGLLVNSGNDLCAQFMKNVSIEGDLSCWDLKASFEIRTRDLVVSNSAEIDGEAYIAILVSPLKFFKIDHPLDPSNKYLFHATVESPDLKTFYDGIAVLDSAGEAVVELPDWFETLNGNFRYQLTPIGAAGPNLYIAEEIASNRFKIAGGIQDMKVSWQVTGIRQDPVALTNSIKVEMEKSDHERGYYLNPKAYNQPENRGIMHKEEKAKPKPFIPKQTRRPVIPQRR